MSSCSRRYFGLVHSRYCWASSVSKSCTQVEAQSYAAAGGGSVSLWYQRDSWCPPKWGINSSMCELVGTIRTDSALRRTGMYICQNSQCLVLIISMRISAWFWSLHRVWIKLDCSQPKSRARQIVNTVGAWWAWRHDGRSSVFLLCPRDIRFKYHLRRLAGYELLATAINTSDIKLFVLFD